MYRRKAVSKSNKNGKSERVKSVPFLTGMGLMQSLLKTLKCHRMHSHSENKLCLYSQSILKSLQTYMVHLAYIFTNSSPSGQEPLDNNYIYLSNQCIVHAAENSGWASFFFSG